ncbi:MAG: hypothetical protein ACRDJ4_08600 [Actinomycetota bacterium]
MEDESLIDRINELAREEPGSFEKESRGPMTEADRHPWKKLGVTLDQC